MAVDVRKLTEEYMLDMRTAGERAVAFVRLLLLIPIAIMVASVFASNLAGGDTLAEIVAKGAIPVTVGGVLVNATIAVWLVRKLKKPRSYRNWMAYALPLVDCTIIVIIILSYARVDQPGYVWMTSVTWFFVVFLVLSAFRSSVASVVVCGVYAAAWMAGLTFWAGVSTGAFGGAFLFTNALGAGIKVQLDDEIVKPCVILITTALLAVLARTSNKRLAEQIESRVRHEELKEALEAQVRGISSTIDGACSGLEAASAAHTAGVERMIAASKEIDGAAAGESVQLETATSAVTQMIHSNASIAESIERQAGLVRESAAAIDEMGGTIAAMTSTASKAEEIAANLVRQAEEGGATVRDAVMGARDTREASSNIEDIMSMISAIADSTNILAMNAAIEAAHAGAAGRGFAVVADEIRKLAESTATSAHQVDEILETIAEKAGTIVSLSERADANLGSILEDAKATADINRELLGAMREQDDTMRLVLGSVRDLEAITESVRASSSEQGAGSKTVLEAMEALAKVAERVRALTRAQSGHGSSVADSSAAIVANIAKTREAAGSLSSIAEKV